MLVRDENLQEECNDICRVDYAYCRLLCESDYCLSICERSYKGIIYNCTFSIPKIVWTNVPVEKTAQMAVKIVKIRSALAPKFLLLLRQ